MVVSRRACVTVGPHTRAFSFEISIKSRGEGEPACARNCFDAETKSEAQRFVKHHQLVESYNLDADRGKMACGNLLGGP